MIYVCDWLLGFLIVRAAGRSDEVSVKKFLRVADGVADVGQDGVNGGHTEEIPEVFAVESKLQRISSLLV